MMKSRGQFQAAWRKWAGGALAAVLLGLVTLLAPPVANAAEPAQLGQRGSHGADISEVSLTRTAPSLLRVAPMTLYTGSGGCFIRTYSDTVNWLGTETTQITLKNVCPATMRAKVEGQEGAIFTWSACTSVSRDASWTVTAHHSIVSNTGTTLTGRWQSC